ncbi:hypothetical protein AbaMCR56_02950, partial [Acinetobacter baumannii]
IYGIRSTTYPSYALNLAQLGGFVFQIFVQQSLTTLSAPSNKFPRKGKLDTSLSLNLHGIPKP